MSDELFEVDILRRITDIDEQVSAPVADTPRPWRWECSCGFTHTYTCPRRHIDEALVQGVRCPICKHPLFSGAVKEQEDERF